MSYIKTNWVNDQTELNAENMNHIEDGIEKAYGQLLLAVSSTAPSECSTGDKYFNTTTNKIYTATGTDTWGTTGVDAELGVFYIVLEDQTIYTYDGTTLVSVGGGAGGGDSAPIGQVSMFAGSTAPDGFLLCDGSAVSRTTYSDLFQVIGTTYGAGDGSTTFNLPNIKGRTVVMQDSTQTEFDTLGETGGSKYLQEHKHSYNNTNGHFSGGVNTSFSAPTSGGNATYSNDTQITTGGVLTSGTGGVTTGNSGNLQPYIVLNYIVKATKVTSTQAEVVNVQSDSTTDAYSCDYINDNFEMKGTILYQNNSGATGNLTLNDDISNYKYYEIIPYSNESHAIKNRVGTKSIVSRQAYDGTYIYNTTQTITLTGTSLSKTSIYQWYGALSNPYQNQSTTDWLSIYQVIGYK